MRLRIFLALLVVACLTHAGMGMPPLNKIQPRTDAEIKAFVAANPNSEVVDINADAVTNDGIKELQGLKKLKYLQVGGKLVTEESLEGLANLPNLEEFNFEVHSPACITNAGLKSVAKFPRLKVLKLFGNCKIDGQGVSQLKDMPALESIEFGSTPLKDADFKAFNDLKNLKSLTLNAFQVTDDGLAALKDAPKLEMLSIQCGRVTGSRLAELKNLKSFIPRFAVDDAMLKNLDGMTSLKTLELANEYLEKATDAGFNQIKDMAGLEELSIGSKNLSEAGLKGIKELKNLKKLNLAMLKADDDVARDLAGLPNLIRLSLGMPMIWPQPDPSGSALTDAGVKAIANGCPKLEFLRLDLPLATNAAMKDIARCGKLQELWINIPKVTDAGLLELCVLKNVHQIGIKTSRDKVSEEAEHKLFISLHANMSTDHY